MAKIIKHITIDVASGNVVQPIVAKQGDVNSRFIKASLTNEGEDITVDPTSTVMINAVREDGEAKAFAGTVNDDGTVTVPITSWKLELDGEVECDISVIDSKQRKLSSTSFKILVEPALYGGDEVSEDENYDILTNLIAECQEATSEVGDISAALDAIIDIQKTLIGGAA